MVVRLVATTQIKVSDHRHQSQAVLFTIFAIGAVRRIWLARDGNSSNNFATTACVCVYYG